MRLELHDWLDVATVYFNDYNSQFLYFFCVSSGFPLSGAHSHSTLHSIRFHFNHRPRQIIACDAFAISFIVALNRHELLRLSLVTLHEENCLVPIRHSIVIVGMQRLF